MKKYVKKLLATLLASVMLVSNALPVAAAGVTHSHTETSTVNLSELSDSVWEFVAKFTAGEGVKSAFGKTINGYKTEAVKNAIWNAIFMNRDSNVINFSALGISKGDANALTAEVLAEANAEDAVVYSVRENEEGETVVETKIDPMYEAAYDEIDAATANVVLEEETTANEGIMLLAEDDEAETAGSTMQDAYDAFNAYQQYIDANPDYFGITVPYTSVKDDSNEGGGPITSLVTIANQKVDYNQDGVIDENDNGITMLDLFKAGYVSPDDLIQIIQMFDTGNQLAVALFGDQLLASKDEALSAVPSTASDEQRLLILNDWLADKATFDMATIMELPAPEPVDKEAYTMAVYALTQQGLSEEEAAQFASQLMGLWGGTQFGVLCDSFGNTGVCMGYTYAYAYLVQWEFEEVYKTNGEWNSRVDMNYIANPAKEATAEIALASEESGECNHEYEATWEWAEDYSTAKVILKCTKCDLSSSYDADITSETTATCKKDGVTTYTAIVKVDDEEYTDERSVETKATGQHKFDENQDAATWEWNKDEENGVTAKATVICQICDINKTITADVQIESSEKSTCDKYGYETWKGTAEIGGNTYEDTRTFDLPLVDHEYDENGVCTECGDLRPDHTHTYDEPVWSEWDDNNTTTATFTCETCKGEIIPENVIISEKITNPTCTEAGYITYTASVEFEDKTYTNSETKKVAGDPATGHTYGAPEFTWADDCTATATFTCITEGCGVTTTEKADITSETTATCTEDGITTYTASVTIGEGEDAVTYTAEETKEVETKATGHTFDEDGVCTVCGETDLPDYVWDSSAPAMVDYVRITYDAEVTMYGVEQENFDSDHYWNAVKVNGEWYYVDPCYTDIYVECMVRDRVETDGNMSHLYFMFSDTNARELYSGNFSSIDTLYENIATDTTYESAWFAFARSPIYQNGTDYYYFYDSTDMISLTTNSSMSYNQDTEYKLVYHDGTKEDSDDSYVTLIDFVEGEVRVVENGSASMKANDMIATLYAEHEAYQEKYPSIAISCDMEGSRVYFNISNCILYYDIDTCEVVKVFEYNEVTAERDLSVGLGGMGFFVVDSTEEETAEETEDAELTTLTVENNPIASMTIKNGNMYVSVGTTIGFISGKDSMSEEDTSIGYQFEETNYNPDYLEYVMSEGMYSQEEEENDNDEFMWSANFVDVIEMSHINGEHTYEEVEVAATCGKNAYTENRCTECGAIEEGTRVEIEGTALEHHYIEFEEQYYTKEGDAWNTGTCYVCTVCKDAKDELEDGDHLGHEYVGVVTEWAEDYSTATMDVICDTCYGVNYDCVLADETVVLAEDLEATVEQERSTIVDVVVDEETGEETEVKSYYYTYTATVTCEGVDYTGSITVPRDEDKYDRNPFTDVSNDAWYTDAVLWAAENGITAGYEEEDGTYTFRPNESSTRAHVVTFLWNEAGQPEPETTENPFTDVKEGQWYYKAVLWAAENGITAGYEEDGTYTFRPNDICTRAHVVTFLWNQAEQPEPETTENPFADVKEGQWYYKAVLWAAENGITAGYEEEDGTYTFRPTKECIRAEIVQFLYNANAEE